MFVCVCVCLCVYVLSSRCLVCRPSHSAVRARGPASPITDTVRLFICVRRTRSVRFYLHTRSQAQAHASCKGLLIQKRYTLAQLHQVVKPYFLYSTSQRRPTVLTTLWAGAGTSQHYEPVHTPYRVMRKALYSVLQCQWSEATGQKTLKFNFDLAL